MAKKKLYWVLAQAELKKDASHGTPVAVFMEDKYGAHLVGRYQQQADGSYYVQAFDRGQIRRRVKPNPERAMDFIKQVTR